MYMKKLINRLTSDQFFSAAFWVFIGTGFLNAGNYLYHLIMARMLGVSLYGALESIISLLYILSVPTTTITLVIVKFVSTYKGRGNVKAISQFYNYLNHKIIIFGLITTVILVVLSPFIQKFLHLPSLFIVLLLPISFLFNLLYFLNKSVLQGLSNFFKFSFLNFLEAIAKVTFAILLVAMGFGAEGAFGGVVVSIIITLIVSYLYMRKTVSINFKTARDYLEKRELLKFVFPAFITTLSLTSLFTTDVIMVRHFLPHDSSGYYSALSVLGKIIFFACSPIVMVIFPLISEAHAKEVAHTRFLVIGLIGTLLISSLITLIYFLFPTLMVNILFGDKYLVIKHLMGVFGIFMVLYSVSGLLANYYLSIHKTFASYLVLIAAVGQIVGLYLFHSSLEQVIYVSILVTFLLLISLLLYYPHAKSR